MAGPSNKFGGSVVLNSNGGSIPVTDSSSPTPTDNSTGAAVNGALVPTSTGLWQRIAGTWTQLVTNSNSASGRFISGTATIPNGFATVSVANPTGVANGDRVVCSFGSDPGGTVTTVHAAVAGGNIVFNTIGGTVGADTTVFYIVDTAT